MHQSIDLSTYTAPLRTVLKNPRSFKKFVSANKKELTYWALLIVSILAIYFGISDGDPSFGYTISAIIQMFGFLLIATKAYSAKSVSGLSLNSFICYAVSLFAKLCSIIPYDGYLPYDSTGDIIFRASEVLTFIICLSMIFMMKKKFNHTYNETKDSIPCIVLIVPTLILACLIHPSLNGLYHGDLPWTFGLYLEAVAMLPQLYMLAKKEGEIEVVTSHYVASQGFSRCLAIIFWVQCYSELNEPGAIWTLFPTYVGHIIMLFQVIQILLFSDFLYEYVKKNMRKGLTFSLGYMV